MLQTAPNISIIANEAQTAGLAPDAAARPCRIGPFTLPLPAMQAGLAGYSDMAMRVVARRRGCPYAVTEALLDQVLLRGGRGREKGAILCEADHPVAGQLMGSEAEELAAAAKILIDAGFDVIDLNFACPVRKVMGRCRGGYLLSDPKQALLIMRRVRDAIGDHPLSIKLRRALNESAQAADWFDEVFNEAVTLQFAAIAVHGRTVEQKYTGRANWDFLAGLKSRLAASGPSNSQIPNLSNSPTHHSPALFGSGDVFTAQDALAMYRQTNLDGIWIARGAIGNPWIFNEFAALLAGRPLPEPPTIHAQRDALREHFHLAVEIYGEDLASRQMRKLGIKYAKLHPNGPQVWKEFIAVKNQAQWDEVLTRHYTHDAPGLRALSVPDAEDTCNIG